MIGQTISHYRILEKLGEGGMGIVYKALDTRLNRQVALKFLPTFVTENSEEKARFLQEAQAISSLNHPHIATIHDVEELPEHKFIVLEYIEGGTLKQRVRHKQLPFREVLDAAIQIAEGLSYAHRKSIVHRDIKTDNMMVTSEGQVKIADFGLAKLKGATKVTRAGSTVGTAAYMSPEQAQGSDADHRSDIFSYGVVLYELTTGELPFKGEHEAALLYEVVNTAPKPLKELRPDVPDELQRIAAKAMEKQPGERYQNMDELLIDLRRLRKEFETREILRQSGARPAVAKKKPRWMVPGLVGLGAAAAVAVYFLLLSPRPEKSTASGRKMLVVLPFQNLGQAEDEYFADGITEEITARLAGIHSLGIISRTSAIQYKNTDKNPKEIGRELGVDYVLEGTIRWQRSQEGPSRVRVTPQLIRVSDDTHLWANVYDEAMTEVFKMQSDIAKQVVDAMDVALLEPERKSLEAKPTDNLEAYDYFLRGKDYFNRSYSLENVRIVLQMYEKAVEADPNFALAYANLSRSHARMFWFYYDHTRERLAKAKEAVDKSLKLDPELPEAHLALGFYYYFGFLDYDRALEQFETALKSQPNNSELWAGIGFVKRRQGKIEEAVVNLKKAAELDPRAPLIAANLGGSYALLRDYASAERWSDHAILLAPDLDVPYGSKASVYLRWHGDTKMARETLEKATEKVDRTKFVFNFMWLDIYDGDYRSALDRLASAREDADMDQFHYYPTSLIYGQVYNLMNENTKAEAYYDSARIALEAKIKKDPEDPRYRSAVGIAYAGLGKKAVAIREGKRAVELLPVSKEAVRGTVRVEELAQIYAMVGEYDSAIDQLEYLLSVPSQISRALLRLDPKWTALRSIARFQKLLASSQ